jgi:septin family protein
MSWLIRNPEKWTILWNEHLLQVLIDFHLKELSALTSIMPYSDWKALALQMFKVSHDRPNVKDEALTYISSERSLYHHPGKVPEIYLRPHDWPNAETSQEMKEELEKRIQLSAEDKRSKIRKIVTVGFGKSHISLPREEYLIFENDILKTDKKLDTVVQKAFKQ